MMDEKALPPHTVAEGPEGLALVLDQFLQRSKLDASFAAADQYILYRNNQQRALIKVGMSQQPFHFWYYDLLGRPATKMVKEVVGRFLWEKCGEKEHFLSELSSRDQS